MIIRIGSHDVELVPHPNGASLLVGEIDGFKIVVEAESYRTRPTAYTCTVSIAADPDGHVCARVERSTIEEAMSHAVERAVERLSAQAQQARREYEQLDVHALRVADRMRETAAIAERARALLAPKLPEAT